MEASLINEDLLISTGRLVYDYIPVQCQNICVVQYIFVKESNFFIKGTHICDISKIKYTNNLYYNKIIGMFYYIVGDDTVKNVLHLFLNETNIKSPINYETFRLDYSSNNLIQKFNLTSIKQRVINDKKQSSLKYSFGLEFETKNGVIPEYLCYRNGLIPLRDGSISGYEYSTIILGKTYGLSMLKSQLELLKKFTTFDKECSLHIHFGRLPIDIRFAYLLYRLCYTLQGDLLNYIPRYALKTSKFKKSEKDYCKELPFLPSISDFYNYFLESTIYDDLQIEDIDLTVPHPNDRGRNRKWNIHSRYHWINFINLLFYNKHKTVEFRFLAPTYNFNKIVGWIFVFTAIIDVAEQYYNYVKEKNLSLPDFYALVHDMESDNHSLFSICKNSNVNDSLLYFLEDLRRENICQNKLHDYTGENTELDDLFCKYKFIK